MLFQPFVNQSHDDVLWSVSKSELSRPLASTFYSESPTLKAVISALFQINQMYYFLNGYFRFRPVDCICLLDVSLYHHDVDLQICRLPCLTCRWSRMWNPRWTSCSCYGWPIWTRSRCWRRISASSSGENPYPRSHPSAATERHDLLGLSTLHDSGQALRRFRHPNCPVHVVRDDRCPTKTTTGPWMAR